MRISLPNMGKRLRSARESKGLSIEAAAAITGIGVRSLYKYESHGVRNILTLEALCDAYNVPIESVLFGPSPTNALQSLPDDVIAWCKAISKADDERQK